MALIQLIESELDRTVETGPGNWTGDFTWEPGPTWGKTGYLAFDLPIADLIKYAVLNYPNFKAPPDSGIKVEFDYYIDPAFMKGVYSAPYLLDGVYELTAELHKVWPGYGWASLWTLILTPPDWNELNATLKIKVYSPELPPSYTYLKNFSATTGEVVGGHKDHLPLIGVH
jgi:hypothetical protein